jgi:O-methyltransferase involved in polyketide biosynthesis
VIQPVRRTFPGQRDQIAHARGFVKRAVGCCPMLDEAVLLTSELCTNTLQHTASGNGGTFEVTVYRAHDSLRVEVRDDGSQTIPAVGQSGELSEDGRGLEIVHLIASRWGQTGDENGRSVFFELRWTCPQRPRPQPAPTPTTMTQANGMTPVNDELEALHDEFPGFRIWTEIIGERARYIARSTQAGKSPHTLVTDDLGELRAVLRQNTEDQARILPYDTTTPNIARMYNYWTGGKDHLAADRLAADAVLADFPEVAVTAQANRDFVTRAVRHVATQGITQYIDIGTGLPASPAVHEIASRAQPSARVAYVDNDPVVLTHARALATAGPHVTVIPGDMRQPDAILRSPDLRALIDLHQPVCVLLASVLHFVTPDEADAIVATFTETMAPGSYLILSAGTSTGTSPALIGRLQAAYQNTTVVTGRTEAEIAAYFTGLDLEPPGLVDVHTWRPGRPQPWLQPASARILGAVARKPLVIAIRAARPQLRQYQQEAHR